jgi:hypothetical protein
VLEQFEDRVVPAAAVAHEYAGLNVAEGGVMGAGYTPPDTCGAAGPDRYVETVNSAIALYTSKTAGGTPVTGTFENFMVTQSGLPRVGGNPLIDPIVVWDDQDQRFIVGVQNVDNGSAHISRFDLAVSKSASPSSLTTADWWFLQIDTTENNGSTQIYDADYPGNFGYNHDAFVFTLNMFDVSRPFTAPDHVQVNSVNLSGLINGSLLSFRNDVPGASLRPTVMHDSVAGDPMWLLEDGNGSSIKVLKMTNVLSSPASFTTFNLSVNAYSLPSTPLQPDGSRVALAKRDFPDDGELDARILKAAEWNGTLVATHIVGNTAGDRDLARWYAINVSSGTPTLADQGDAGSPGSAGLYDYYPSIDINSRGAIGMTFMRSGTAPGQYVSVYVTGRVPTDPAATMQAPVLVQGGEGILAGARRAGDLSGISVDSDGSFWAANEYANDAFSTNGFNWGTAIANFGVECKVALSGSVLTVTGGETNDSVTVRLKAGDSTKVEVVVGLTVIGTFTVGTFSSISVSTGGGDDLVTVDYANGNPVPSGGLNYDGGAGANVLVERGVSQGSSSTTTFTAIPGTSTVGGSVNVAGAVSSQVNFNTTVGQVNFDAGSGGTDVVNTLPVAGATTTFIVYGSTGTAVTKVTAKGASLQSGQTETITATPASSGTLGSLVPDSGYGLVLFDSAVRQANFYAGNGGTDVVNTYPVAAATTTFIVYGSTGTAVTKVTAKGASLQSGQTETITATPAPFGGLGSLVPDGGYGSVYFDSAVVQANFYAGTGGTNVVNTSPSTTTTFIVYGAFGSAVTRVTARGTTGNDTLTATPAPSGGLGSVALSASGSKSVYFDSTVVGVTVQAGGGNTSFILNGLSTTTTFNFVGTTRNGTTSGNDTLTINRPPNTSSFPGQSGTDFTGSRTYQNTSTGVFYLPVTYSLMEQVNET